VVPRGRRDLVVEADARRDAVLGGGVVEVLQDLTLQSVASVPPGALLVRERVQRRRDVAAGPGVVVVAPHATEGVGALPQAYVVVAGSGHFDRHGEGAEARTDDADAQVVTHASSSATNNKMVEVSRRAASS